MTFARFFLFLNEDLLDRCIFCSSEKNLPSSSCPRSSPPAENCARSSGHVSSIAHDGNSSLFVRPSAIEICFLDDLQTFFRTLNLCASVCCNQLARTCLVPNAHDKILLVPTLPSTQPIHQVLQFRNLQGSTLFFGASMPKWPQVSQTCKQYYSSLVALQCLSVTLMRFACPAFTYHQHQYTHLTACQSLLSVIVCFQEARPNNAPRMIVGSV